MMTQLTGVVLIRQLELRRYIVYVNFVFFNVYFTL